MYTTIIMENFYYSVSFPVFLGVVLLQQVLGNSPSPLISKASNEFTFKTYEVLSKEPGNMLFCPLSLHVALGLLHQGAGGQTAQELATALGLTSTNSEIKEGYKTLLTGLQDETLKIVTKLYPKNGYQLNENYINLARDVFKSGVETLNYSDPASAVKTINKYVEENTNGKIDNLIEEKFIDLHTRLIMVNAIHFDAMWKTSFKAAYDSDFRLSPSESKRVIMMPTSGYFNYKEDSNLDATVLKMDYKGGDYNMIIVLPKEGDANSSYSLSLNDVVGKLSSISHESLFTGYENKSVHVRIPKFKIETSLSLKVYLQKLGINQVFTDDADLHGIADGDDLSVSEVVQKTFIDVNEEGTEAAAASGTLVGIKLSGRNDPAPEVFVADRPFLFFVVKGNTILFAGRYEKPN